METRYVKVINNNKYKPKNGIIYPLDDSGYICYKDGSTHGKPYNLSKVEVVFVTEQEYNKQEGIINQYYYFY